MKWAVEIEKTGLQGRNLTDLLGGIGFTLVDGVQCIAFTSPQVDASATAHEAFEIAKRVRAAFTGPGYVDPQFVLGSVIDYSVDPPRLSKFVELTGIASTMSMGNLGISTSCPTRLSIAEVAQWTLESEGQRYQAKLERQRSTLEPAFLNANASRMLEMLDVKDPSGEVIYKIYELAEGHPDNRKAFHAQLGISTNEFRRFADAVHNPTVTGEWARHAYPDTPKSSNPMTKDEAEQFARRVAEKWLAFVRATKSP